MQIQKLKLAAYAISKRMQGYQLLRNPKHVSPLYLRMIKCKTDIGDDVSIHRVYDRITKDFSENSDVAKETLYSYIYYPTKLHNSKEKYLSYLNLKTYDNASKGIRHRNRPSFADIYTPGSFWVNWNILYDLLPDLSKQRYYSRFSSKIGRLREAIFGFSNVDYSKPLRPSFFSTLRHNLKEKS